MFYVSFFPLDISPNCWQEKNWHKSDPKVLLRLSRWSTDWQRC